MIPTPTLIERAELLSCPFCDSDEVFTKEWEDEGGATRWLARCSACGCGTPSLACGEAGIIAYWNKRAALKSPRPTLDVEGVARIVRKLLTEHGVGDFHVPVQGRLERQAIGSIVALLSSTDGWREIDSAPRDGTPILAYLNQTGIRQLRWMSPAECASYEDYANDVADYDGCWVQVGDETQEYNPLWWLPIEALPPPPHSEGEK